MQGALSAVSYGTHSQLGVFFNRTPPDCFFERLFSGLKDLCFFVTVRGFIACILHTHTHTPCSCLNQSVSSLHNFVRAEEKKKVSKALNHAMGKNFGGEILGSASSYKHTADVVTFSSTFWRRGGASVFFLAHRGMLIMQRPRFCREVPPSTETC